MSFRMSASSLLSKSTCILFGQPTYPLSLQTSTRAFSQSTVTRASNNSFNNETDTPDKSSLDSSGPSSSSILSGNSSRSSSSSSAVFKTINHLERNTRARARNFQAATNARRYNDHPDTKYPTIVGPLPGIPPALDRQLVVEAEEARIIRSKKYDAGEILNPYDLNSFRTPREMPLFKGDMFKLAGINPLDMWTDAVLLSSYVSPIGKILPGKSTGTSPKNQKRLSKAIKRARAAGLLSAHHRAIPRL